MAGPKKDWKPTLEQLNPDKSKGEFRRGTPDSHFENEMSDEDWAKSEAIFNNETKIAKEEAAIDALLDGDDTLFNELEY